VLYESHDLADYVDVSVLIAPDGVVDTLRTLDDRDRFLAALRARAMRRWHAAEPETAIAIALGRLATLLYNPLQVAEVADEQLIQLWELVDQIDHPA
jgi:hypothetical protein